MRTDEPPKEIMDLFLFSVPTTFRLWISKLCYRRHTNLGPYVFLTNSWTHYYEMFLLNPGNNLCFEVYFIWCWYSLSSFLLIPVIIFKAAFSRPVCSWGRLCMQSNNLSFNWSIWLLVCLVLNLPSHFLLSSIYSLFFFLISFCFPLDSVFFAIGLLAIPFSFGINIGFITCIFNSAQ